MQKYYSITTILFNNLHKKTLFGALVKALVSNLEVTGLNLQFVVIFQASVETTFK